MRLFGDDGFRDKFGKGFLKEDFLIRFFKSLNFFLISKKIKNVFIGHDTRKSKEKILKILLKNLNYPKKILLFKNAIPTPGLHHYVEKNPSYFGIMITASHFQNNYNGFKFFYKGKKLSIYYENKIIKILYKKKFKSNFHKNTQKKNKNLKIVSYNSYIHFLNKKFIFNSKKKILIDFANGAASPLKNKLSFLKNHFKIYYQYNGTNINKKCGSLYLLKNLSKKNFKQKDFCISFDGDADRVSFSEKEYGKLESEKVALIFIKYLKSFKRKKIKSIVSTNIVNPWFKKKMRDEKIKLYISKVGDRNIINKQIKTKSIFGYETSDHYSFNHKMDGLYAAGFFLEILNYRPDIIYKVINEKIDYKLSKFKVRINKLNKIKKLIKSNQKMDDLKIVLRKSIWNSFHRLYLFQKYNSKQTKFENQVRNLLK